MDMKSDHASLVLADPSPLTNNRLGIPSNLISCTSPATYIPACPPSRFFTSNRKKYAPSKLDDIRGNGCLDAMQASSPTHKYSSKGMDLSAMSPNSLDAAYHSWTLKHPSALASFEQISMSAKGKKVALFLDYDGTLSPIVDDPDRAFMSETMRAVVSDVAKCFHTAIISGRCREKVYEFVGLGELYYAGSHGLDIMGPPLVSESNDSPQSCVTSPSRKEKDVPFQPAAEYLPIINEVLELRPVIKWDKGKALEFLLDSLDCSDVFPIYIGDDRTDEDAFKVLRQKYKGYGILVSAVPKETCAYYSLRDPSEVMDFLRCLTKWQNTGEIKT